MYHLVISVLVSSAKLARLIRCNDLWGSFCSDFEGPICIIIRLIVTENLYKMILLQIVFKYNSYYI